MSWKFGPFVVSNDDIADIDTVNENFLSVIDEVTSQLNEHNFVQLGFDDRLKWTKDIGLRMHQVKAPYGATSFNESQGLADSWLPINPDFEKTFTTKCRQVWVIASFQVEVNCIYGGFLALEVDGVVIGESIVGSGDFDNDAVTAFGAFSSTPGLFLMNNGLTLPAQGGPVVLDAVISITPGQHTVRVVAMPVKGESDDGVVLRDHELLVVEMW